MPAPRLVLGVLHGEDIGHEIVPAAVQVASAAAERHGLAVEWRPMPIGRQALDSHVSGTTWTMTNAIVTALRGGR